MDRPYVYSLLLLCFIIGFTFASEQKEDKDHDVTSSSQSSSTSSSSTSAHNNSSTKPSTYKSTTATTLAGCLALDNDAESTAKAFSKDPVFESRYSSDFPSG